jgi:hypothetical protein
VFKYRTYQDLKLKRKEKKEKKRGTHKKGIRFGSIYEAEVCGGHS